MFKRKKRRTKKRGLFHVSRKRRSKRTYFTKRRKSSHSVRHNNGSSKTGEVLGLVVILLLIVASQVPDSSSSSTTASMTTLNFTAGIVILVGIFWLLLFIIKMVYRKVKTNARAKKRQAIGIDDVDLMDGFVFEQYVAELLEDLGFKKVEVTKGSGDQGVDVMATLDKTRYGIQCKRSGGTVGNKAVQEVLAGIIYYDDCNRGIVITNGQFSKSAINLARSTDIILWDREVLIDLLTDRLKGKKYASEQDLDR